MKLSRCAATLEVQRYLPCPRFLYCRKLGTTSGVLVSPPTGLQCTPGWHWLHDGIKRKGWALNTSQWQSLVPCPTPVFTQMNNRWSVHWDNAEWLKLWQHLWKGWGHPPSRLVIWRILHQSYFTNCCGALWGVCFPTAPDAATPLVAQTIPQHSPYWTVCIGLKE
jgi:hypothetical protein